MIVPFAVSLVFVAPPSHVPTRVEIDVDPLVANGSTEHPDQERAMATEVGMASEESLSRALGDLGVPPASGEPDATVRVQLDWKVYLDTHYTMRIEVERDGKTTVVTEALECRLCDAPKVAAVVGGQAAKIAKLLTAKPAAEDPPPGDPPDGPPGDPGTPDDPPDTDQPKGKAIGPLGYAGIATAAAGLGGIVGGAVLLSRGEQISLDAEPRNEAIEDYRPAGTIALAVGGGLLVTGAVLLIVDQTVGRKKRDRHAAQSRGTFAPMLSPQHAGLHASFRF